MVGAAISTLVAYVVLFVGMTLYAQRVYPVAVPVAPRRHRRRRGGRAHRRSPARPDSALAPSLVARRSSTRSCSRCSASTCPPSARDSGDSCRSCNAVAEAPAHVLADAAADRTCRSECQRDSSEHEHRAAAGCSPSRTAPVALAALAGLAELGAVPSTAGSCGVDVLPRETSWPFEPDCIAFSPRPTSFGADFPVLAVNRREHGRIDVGREARVDLRVGRNVLAARRGNNSIGYDDAIRPSWYQSLKIRSRQGLRPRGRCPRRRKTREQGDDEENALHRPPCSPASSFSTLLHGVRLS